MSMPLAGFLDERLTGAHYRQRPAIGLALRSGATIMAAAIVWASAPGPMHAHTGGSRVEQAALPPYPIDPETAPRPMARAYRTDEQIVTDGRLTEDIWQRIQPITELIQREPHLGHPASERSEIRLVYDEKALYVSAVLYDSHMDGIAYAGFQRDGDAGSGDQFGFSLDTFSDRRNCFAFFTGPGGAIFDLQCRDDGGNINRAWDGVVHIAEEVTDSAWIVEIAVPFTTLRFDPEQLEGGWGLQIFRRIRRKNEVLYWAPLGRAYNSFTMSRAGRLVGLADIKPGRSLRVKPYVLAKHSLDLASGDGTTVNDGNAGLDVKYSVTSTVTADLSYRTDFAHVETDQQQVNLTRFPLFFPERREFFLDNAGIFAFGDAGWAGLRTSSAVRDFVLFHSRRIGLVGSAPIPILAGGRITGTMDEWEFGILNMQTESTAALPAENFSALLLKKNVLGNSAIGVMALNRQVTGEREEPAPNRSWGAEANFRLFDNRLFVDSYVAASNGPDTESDGAIGRLSVGWRDRRWNASMMMKAVGRAFDPGMGFIARRANRHYYGTVGYLVRPDVSWLQEVQPFVEMDYITDLSSRLETRRVDAGLDIVFLDSGVLGFALTHEFEVLARPFTVSSATEIPPGTYEGRQASVQYQLGRGRRFTGNVRGLTGGYFGGTRQSLSLGTAWWARSNLNLQLNLDYNQVDLPTERFTASVGGARIQYDHSPRLFASVFVQYLAATDETLTNLRINFRYAPLSDIFIVYSERRHVSASTIQERVFAVKATKLFAF